MKQPRTVDGTVQAVGEEAAHAGRARQRGDADHLHSGQHWLCNRRAQDGHITFNHVPD